MNTVPTGIKGLDQVLEGGFKRPATIIVSGLPGTGKSVFIMQSIFRAALNGEKICLFLFNTVQKLNELNQTLSKFSFYDGQMYEKNHIKFYRIDLNTEEDGGLDAIKNTLEIEKPSRIVIDYAAMQQYGFKDPEWFVGKVSDLVSSKGLIAYLAVNSNHDGLGETILGRSGDEIFQLSFEAEGNQKSRFIDIIKSHSRLYLNHRLNYVIGDDGIDLTVPVTQNAEEIINNIENIRNKIRIRLVSGVGAIGLGLILLTAVPGIVPPGRSRLLLTVLGAVLITGGIYVFASPRS